MLWLLKQIELSEPQTVEMLTLLEELPGHKAMDRLLLCDAVLRRCFAPLLMREDEKLWTLSVVDLLRLGPPPSGTPLKSTVLNWQTDRAFARWVKRFGMPDKLEPERSAELLLRLRAEADRGDLDAKYLLAVAGGNKVLDRLQLLSDAACSGNVDAQCALGVFYYLGELVQKDQALGEKWLRQAAKSGNKTANVVLNRLGTIS